MSRHIEEGTAMHQAVEAALAADREAALRDVFAAAAMSGMIASNPITDRAQIDKRVWALQAYHFADMLLEARKLHPDMVKAKLSTRGVKV